jgi:NADPH2:quinone reductase
MRALTCREYAGPEALQIDEVPTPAPGDGQVLIEVDVAGVSYVDTLIIRNLHQVKHELPFSPGREVAGRISAIGAGVTGFEPGQSVAAILDKGGHAEYAIANASETFPCPDGCPMLAAGAHMSTYLTSWLALKERAALRPEQRVLVLGAGGGTGIAAVESAVNLGAEVVAAASSAEKLSAAAECGAHHLVNYSEQALDEAVKDIWPEGADVVFDPVAGDLFEPASRSVGWNGSYLIIGFAGGAVPQFAANRLLVKNRAALGFILMYYRRFRPDLMHAAADDILKGFADGSLNPRTTDVGSLEEASRMLRAIMDRTAVGKSALRLR